MSAITTLDTLPLRITTADVCRLAGFGRGVLAQRIAMGRMPKPIDRARGHLFDRDAVARALGLIDKQKQEEVATW